VNMREELMLKVLAKEDSIVELGEQYGVSRKTIYKWMKRYEKSGLAGLVDRSRRPHSSPMKTSAELALEILQIRKEHMSWGPKKVAAILARRYPNVAVPSVVTVGRVLREAGLMKRSNRQSSNGLSAATPNYIPSEPNDLWTVDFKGWWRTRDGTRCDPLTVRDAVSRYVLRLQLMTRTRGVDVRPVFEDLFQRYGVPKAIQSDNGPPFASVRAPGGFTALSAWWVSLGIQVVRSRPACPQDNGGHERMHRDIRFELEDNASATTMDQQRACDEWVTTFNHVRPHEALGQRPPSEVYRVSPRRPSSIVIGVYPDTFQIVKADRMGRILYQGWKVYVSAGLAGHKVGLEFHGALVRVWFGSVLIGSFVPGMNDSIEPIDNSPARDTAEPP
jgi:putative transposase